MGWGTCSTASFSAATASSSFDRSCSSSSGAGCTRPHAQPSRRDSLNSPLADLLGVERTTSTHSPSSVAPRSDRSASRSALTLRVTQPPKPSASLLGSGRWHDSNISIEASGLYRLRLGLPAELLACRVLLQPSLQLRPFARRRCPHRLQCVEPRTHVIVQARLLSIMAAMPF